MTLEMFMNDDPVRTAKRIKVCPKCKTSYPATNEYFYRDARRQYGLGCWCKKCHARRKKEVYNMLSKEEKTVANKRVQISKKKSPERTSFGNTRSRVKITGKYKWFLGEVGTPEAEAFIEYMKTLTHCPDCTKEFVWYSDIINNLCSASFDRINSDGHYIKENVRIVCRECNSQKNSSPVDEWVGLLEVRVKKGIIKEVDPSLVEYLIEQRRVKIDCI